MTAAPNIPAKTAANSCLFILIVLHFWDSSLTTQPLLTKFGGECLSPQNVVGFVRVLMIEDDEADVFLVQEILKQSRRPDGPLFEIVVASSLKEGLGMLAEKKPDLILLDLMLPDSRGIDSLRAVVAKAGRTPVVVLSGAEDENLAMEAAHHGAQDFLVKGKVESMWLSRIMRYAVARRPPGSFFDGVVPPVKSHENP